MTLTLDEANRIIAGAIGKAMKIGVAMNIAVCDAGGRLIAAVIGEYRNDVQANAGMISFANVRSASGAATASRTYSTPSACID